MATPTRREFLTQASAAAGAALLSTPRPAGGAPALSSSPARIALTFDLEMSRGFPTADATHWDYEKGNLDAASKAYALTLARRLKTRGVRAHFFLVARALEQEDVAWLKEIAAAGHRVGNHTYDHVALLARTPEETQFRFRRAPWLVEGQTVAEVIAENIRLAHDAIRTRLGFDPVGFRSPGGLRQGLDAREDLQRLILACGYRWASIVYPAHPLNAPNTRPDARLFDAIADVAVATQPRRYPTGLVEVPMSPISDVGAFRNGQWTLDEFLAALRTCVGRVIAARGVFDFLAHPSVLCVVDPEFRAVDLLCDLVAGAGPHADFATLDEVAAPLLARA